MSCDDDGGEIRISRQAAHDMYIISGETPSGRVYWSAGDWLPGRASAKPVTGLHAVDIIHERIELNTLDISPVTHLFVEKLSSKD